MDIAASLGPESKHHSRYQYKEINGRLNSEIKNDTRRNHGIIGISLKVCAIKVAGKAQWLSKQYCSLCPLGSSLASEPNHVDPKQLVAPWRMKPS